MLRFTHFDGKSVSPSQGVHIFAQPQNNFPLKEPRGQWLRMTK